MALFNWPCCQAEAGMTRLLSTVVVAIARIPRIARLNRMIAGKTAMLSGENDTQIKANVAVVTPAT
jgi:hypothetical protein